MKKTNLYDIIENPLNNEEIFFDLLGAYGLNKDMYYALTHNNTEIKPEKDVKDSLTVYYFNKWKNNLLGYKEEDIEKRQNKESLIKLREFLKNIGDFKSSRDYFEFERNLVKDSESEIAKLYMEYFPLFKKDRRANWTHIKSHSLDYQSDKIKDIEHRLYLNVSEEALDDMAVLFIKKCEEKNIPYYFKISTDYQRDDSFVIYSETEYLKEYIEILKEIKNENILISKFIKKPPMLTGVIDKFIGYGTDSNVSEEGKKTSYNKLRSSFIPKVIDKEIIAWAKEKNILSDRNFIEKMTYCSTEMYIEQQEKRAKLYPELDATKKYLKSSQENGYREKIIEIMRQQVTARIKEGKININNLTKNDSVRMACAWMISENKGLQERIKKSISEQAEKLGIDSNNISISKDMIETLKNISIMQEERLDSQEDSDILSEIIGEDRESSAEELLSEIFGDLDEIMGTSEEEKQSPTKLTKKQIMKDITKQIESSNATEEQLTKEEVVSDIAKQMHKKDDLQETKEDIHEDLEQKMSKSEEESKLRKLKEYVHRDIEERIRKQKVHKSKGRTAINKELLQSQDMSKVKISRNEPKTEKSPEVKQEQPKQKVKKKDFRPTGYKAMSDMDILISQEKIGEYKPPKMKK